MNYINLGCDFSYLIKNEIDKKYGIEVNTVGFQSISPNSLYPSNEHPNGYYFNTMKGRVINEYQFIYITSGCGKLSFSQENEISICKGQLIVIFPGQWHTYNPTMETGWNEYYIGFEGKMIDNLITNSYLTNENQVFNTGLNEELLSLYKRALEVAKQEKKSGQQHLSGIVMHIIGLCLYESKSYTVDVEDMRQIIDNSRIIMNENIFNSIYPEEFAQKLNVKYIKFIRAFKSYTGFSPASYFQELKKRKAKQLLIESSYSIKEVANMLKYYSAESFNIAFRKRAGCPVLGWLAWQAVWFPTRIGLR